MKKKHVLLMMPALFLPYSLLGALAIVFFSNKHPYIMQTIFKGNGLLLFAALAVYALLALIFSVIYFILSAVKRQSPIKNAKYAMIIKLIQMPAYIAIFIFGVIFMITPLFAVTFAFLLFNYLALLMSGFVEISSAITAKKDGIISKGTMLAVTASQFIYCVDVIVSIVYYYNLKKKNSQV